MIRSHRLAEASTALRKAVKKKHKAPFDWETAMGFAAKLGDQELTADAARAWATDDPKDARRWIALIEALGAVGKHEEAALVARRLQRDPAAAADGHVHEGIHFVRIGERDLAIRCFRRALEANPGSTIAWEQIALLKGFEDLSVEIDRMRRLERRIKSTAELAPLYYALARAFDHAGEVDDAFRYFSKGGELWRAQAPFDLQPTLDYMARLRRSFTTDLIAELANESGGGEYVFLLSAPRSGSTVIEQILATSPSVLPTGEHMLMRMATLPLASMEPPDIARAREFDRREWKKMAAYYASRVRKRFGAAGVYTDKSMLFYFYLGIAKILFPDAKVILCERDPKDVVWSAFKSRFTGNRWTQNLADCCRFIRGYREQCDHWRAVFGTDIHHLMYERFVEDPEAESARLFDHIGVERPPEWRDFFQAKNPVATASQAQVREPLNAKGVGSWRRYEKHLAPYFDRWLA